jgi:hypothetical protein
MVLLAGVLIAPPARAEDQPSPGYPQIWVNFGMYSLHFDQTKNLRNDNIGLGVEVDLAPDHALEAGTYINSNDARTHYAAYGWRPLHWQVASVNIAAGAAVGAFDGYPNYRNGGWFVAPLPFVAVEAGRVGANLSVIPTLGNRLDGAVTVQLKLRLY